MPVPRRKELEPQGVTPMSNSSLTPQGEDLRRAVAWLAEQRGWTLALIEAACQRFDLSPADEEFLIREFRRRREQGEA
jgi:hypothetical protein